MMRSNSSILFAFIAVTVFVAATAAHAKVTAADVKEICNTTANPRFCLLTLNSDPRTANASLSELAGNTIDRANSTAKSVTGLITSLMNSSKSSNSTASGPTLKTLYESCLENFVDLSYDLNDAKDAAGSGSPADVNIHASAAYTDVDTCEQDFTAVPKQLKYANQRLKNTLSIVLSISNRPWNV